MKIINYPSEMIDLPPLGIALGFFDGMHLGHRELIKMTVEAAKEKGLLPAVFTFPSDSAGLKSGARRLYDTEQKLLMLGEMDVEYVILADFSAVCTLSPEQFVRDVLCRDLCCRLAACGDSFRFGARASGDAKYLERQMRVLGRDALVLDELIYDGEPLSTTRIRAALSEGECKRAAAMLGYPYRIRARVEHGLGLGHSFGFPTVNTALPDGSPLARGVYATKVKIGEKLYTGVTNIGVCPTVGEREEHAETLIADFDGDLYGEELTVYFIDYLREERTFASVDKLKEQIDIDTAKAIEIGEEYNGRKLD